jgi:hypothetical protein
MVLRSPDQDHRSLSGHGHYGAGAEAGAGAILGLHNAVISAPQILSAGISSFVLAMVPGDGEVVWVLRLGGVWMLIAGVLCFRHATAGCFRF